MKNILLAIVSVSLSTTAIFAQGEKMEISGAIQIADSEGSSPTTGTIRWTGSDFQGWNGVNWVSLTGNSTVGSVTDIVGNTYATIRIGYQEWMAENLRVTEYSDGATIDQITDDLIWQGLSSGAWCWSANNSALDIPYGKLYNWFAVSSSKLCPDGWKVPNNADWTTLFEYLGGLNGAGAAMKEVGEDHWNSPNNHATNESGFTALPGTNRSAQGGFIPIGEYGCWWSRDDVVATNLSWYYQINNIHGNVLEQGADKRRGHSVRCIKQ